MSEEIRSAFYWRENMHEALETRRNSEQVKVLRHRVRELRANGKKQREVADILGITVRYVQDLERGRGKE